MAACRPRSYVRAARRLAHGVPARVLRSMVQPSYDLAAALNVESTPYRKRSAIAVAVILPSNSTVLVWTESRRRLTPAAGRLRHPHLQQARARLPTAAPSPTAPFVRGSCCCFYSICGTLAPVCGLCCLRGLQCGDSCTRVMRPDHRCVRWKLKAQSLWWCSTNRSLRT